MVNDSHVTQLHMEKSYIVYHYFAVALFLTVMHGLGPSTESEWSPSVSTNTNTNWRLQRPASWASAMGLAWIVTWEKGICGK